MRAGHKGETIFLAPVAGTLQENLEKRVFYDPTHFSCRFFGLYVKREVRYVAEVSSVVERRSDGSVSIEGAVDLSRAQLGLLVNPPTLYSEEMNQKSWFFYMLKDITPTSVRNLSKQGVMRARWYSLADLLGQPKSFEGAAEVAGALNGREIELWGPA